MTGAPLFSRPIPVDQIPAKGKRVSIEAEAGELAKLAAFLDLVELRALAAQIELKPLGRTGKIAVNGRLTAEATQTCVVSLKPVPASLDEAFSLTFAAEDTTLAEGEEIEVSWDSDDPPDPIIDGVIDVGQVVAEHLALALDPFPRAPDAAFEAPPEPPEEPQPKANPFAVLASIRRKND